MEQQGDIIVDYFTYFHDTLPNGVISASGSIIIDTSIYTTVLSLFIGDPSIVYRRPKQ